MSDQAQKAGAHSQQVQISGDLVVMQGITEERAREIARETAEDVLSTYSAESGEVAMQRVEEFDEAIVNRLRDAGLLGALADPAVQVSFRKAQIGAASTDRQDDYELLAGLIEDRVKRAGDHHVRAGVNRAVEVVDQMDASALTGLTVVQMALQLRPGTDEPDVGLRALERLFNEFLPGPEVLPTGREWIEHLEILDAVRLMDGQNLIPFRDYCAKNLPGYVTAGVPNVGQDLVDGSNEFFALLGKLVPTVPHALKPNYQRLPFVDLKELRKRLSDLGYSEEVVESAIEIARTRFRMDDRDEEAVSAYRDRIRDYPMYAAVADWWDQLSPGFNLTVVGRLLARANARRLDNTGLLPPLG